ncbi:MAG TPA: molecular chaperone DnaJ [Candidatus Kapabacteria bacterium]|nr:molecular chaperone DnaJ [Candidatus Kapabacteria bacterium]
MSKDYYKILGVDKNASADEIKKAFRRLAHQYHPDKKGGDETKFKEVNEAYQVLGDPERRKKFDQFGSDFEQQGGFGGNMNWEDFMRAARGQGGSFGGADFGDIFGDIFGFGGGRSGRRQQRGNDIQVDIELPFREAVFGVEKDIRLTKNNACDVCAGTGAEPGSHLKTCGACQGKGQVAHVQRTILGAMQTVVTCQTCSGQGQIPEKHCKHCGGDGIVRNEVSYRIKIPAGIDNGESIRLEGKGESIGRSGIAGDLYVTVHVREDQLFERDGEDIYTDVHISYPQAVLGDTVDIDTLDGRKKIVIPEGTESHQQIRLRGLGVPRLRGSGRGDHYVRVIIDVPKKVSKTAKKLLEELKDVI